MSESVPPQEADGGRGMAAPGARAEVAAGAPVPLRTHLRYGLVLGCLAAIGPLTLDLYLPALPEMSRQLHASEPVIQLSLTGCLLGLAIGQLTGGPLADVLGRRRPLLAGLAVYVAITLALALPMPVGAFVALRLVQGAAGGMGLVIGTAVVRDRYSGASAARFFSLLVLISGLSPIFAPAIGGQVLLLTPWPGLFALLGLIGTGIATAVAIWLPETLPAALRSPRSARGLLGGMGTLLRDRAFMGCAVPVGVSTAAAIGYISASSFVLQGIYGASPQLYGALFALNGLALVVTSQANAYLVGRIRSPFLLLTGLVLMATSGAILLGLTAFGGIVPLPAILAPLLVVVASNALVGPNGSALALTPHPRAAGAGSALLGLGRFGLGSVAAPLVGLGGPHSAVALAAVVLGCGACGLGAYAALLLPARHRLRA